MKQRLWYIGRRAYDAEGTDCTELFRNYHLKRAPPEKLLARFAVDIDPTDPVIQIAVNHEVPETMSAVAAGAPIDWGVHQVLTSHNFAPESALALHFSGGPEHADRAPPLSASTPSPASRRGR